MMCRHLVPTTTYLSSLYGFGKDLQDLYSSFFGGSPQDLSSVGILKSQFFLGHPFYIRWRYRKPRVTIKRGLTRKYVISHI